MYCIPMHSNPVRQPEGTASGRRTVDVLLYVLLGGGFDEGQLQDKIDAYIHVAFCLLVIVGTFDTGSPVRSATHLRDKSEQSTSSSLIKPWSNHQQNCQLVRDEVTILKVHAHSITSTFVGLVLIHGFNVDYASK